MGRARAYLCQILILNEELTITSSGGLGLSGAEREEDEPVRASKAYRCFSGMAKFPPPRSTDFTESRIRMRTIFAETVIPELLPPGYRAYAGSNLTRVGYSPRLRSFGVEADFC